MSEGRGDAGGALTAREIAILRAMIQDYVYLHERARRWNRRVTSWQKVGALMVAVYLLIMPLLTFIAAKGGHK